MASRILLLSLVIVFSSCMRTKVSVLSRGISTHANVENVEVYEGTDIRSSADFKRRIWRFQRSIDFPAEAQRNDVFGVTEIQFVVYENGTAGNFVILQELGSGCDQAVINALKRTKFDPAINSAGEPVRTLMEITVEFSARAKKAKGQY